MWIQVVSEPCLKFLIVFNIRRIDLKNSILEKQNHNLMLKEANLKIYLSIDVCLDVIRIKYIFVSDLTDFNFKNPDPYGIQKVTEYKR